MSAYEANVVTCVRCPMRQKVCVGSCTCTVDGRDIKEHASAGECPQDRYGKENAVRTPMPTAPPLRPVPESDWPLAVKALALMRADGERGVGDTAARLLAHLGADSMAAAYTKLIGRDCRCGDRRERLNLLYPY